jgi:hypothetical protein
MPGALDHQPPQELGGDDGLELADLAGEVGVPDAELACCLLAAPSRLDTGVL